MGQEDNNVRARARVGSVLNGKYRLERVLGVGGMAAVYAATHLRNANRVAVKVLHRDFAMDPELRGRFLREGYAANSVEHPGTVRILDDDRAEDGAVFLVMELLDGETLEARSSRRGRLPAEEIAQLTYQLLDVLAAAHVKGIVHRDVKPENLFLTRERVLKVLDFGVARLFEGSVTVTRSERILGTPAFMAPEQVLGKTREVDAQSDVWSIGATAFTLLSGRYVHEAATAEEMMVFTASRPARSLATVVGDVPPALVEVIDRALALDKLERWPSARSMQRALAHAYEDAFGAPIPGARPIDEEDEEAPELKTTTIVPETAISGMPTLSEGASVIVNVPGGMSPVATQRIEPSPDSIPPAGSSPVRANRPMRHSTIAGVTATRTKDVSSRAATWARTRARRRRFLFVAVVGTAAIVGSVVVASVVGSRQPPPAATAASAKLEAPALSSRAMGPAVIAPIATVELPSIAVEALPTTAPAPGNVLPKQATPRPQVAAFPPPPPVVRVAPGAPPPSPLNAGCAPPYTVDATTGKKKWKVECL